MLPEVVAGDQTAIAIHELMPEAIVDARQAVDGVMFYIASAQIVDVCRYLREVAGFDRISGITAVDWWPRQPRFEIVYFLHSLKRNVRMRLAVRAGENDEMASVCPVWRGANWYEREVFDLFGVVFRNHPNLERIMMPPDWEGHPLRKDYPVHGHRYSYSDE